MPQPNRLQHRKSPKQKQRSKKQPVLLDVKRVEHPAPAKREKLRKEMGGDARKILKI
jgi:hypothetical protein